MTEVLKIKIIGFHLFDNGNDVNECSAVLEDGTEIRVDPFVGCAYEYEKKDELLNNRYIVEGHYHEALNCPKSFIVSEGKMEKIK